MALSWKSLTTHLEELEETLGVVPAPCAAEEIPEWIATLSFRDVTGVDALVIEMLQTRHWPEMDQKQQAQIHLRLSHAKQFCLDAQRGAFAGVHGYKGRPPWRDLDLAMDCLLLDTWWRTGMSWELRG